MKRFFLYLLFCCTLVSNFEESMAAKIRHYNFEVSYIYWSPDCEERMMIGINGKFPGPTIHAKAGDTIVVKLTNNLPTEGVVIHWHGIRQLGTPWADGTASISQCAINPDETFVYRFKVDKAGTYFYHGHYGMQRAAGLYGSLIVDVADGEEPFRYDGEHSLLLSDWWHESVQVQMLGISSIPFRWVGEPQTILINGRGQYNCNLASNFTRGTKLCKITDSKCAPVVLQVFPNKTYRLRIASITSVSSLNLAIGNHKMTVVEADGNYVKPVTVNDIDIYSGESYSVLITTDQNSSSNYWLSIGIRGRIPKTQPALAILNYHPNSQAKLPTSKPLVTPKWNKYSHNKAFAHKIVAMDGSTSIPPSSSDRQIALLNTQNKIDGYIKWSINNISLVVPPTPYLRAMKYGLKHVFDAEKPPENFSEDYDVMRPPINQNSRKGSSVYKLEFNSTIDVILQNSNVLSGNVSEIHPWHLHGHDFWVLGYGEGKFKKGDVDMFNLKNPPMKNTVVVFPYGWTAIRFVANNPGVWAFHCHIEPHLHMGMGIIFAEGIEFVSKISDEALACGIVGQK